MELKASYPMLRALLTRWTKSLWYSLPAAWVLLHLLTLRWHGAGTEADGPVPPSWGFPLPWAAFSGASSLSWVLSAPALVLDLLTYTVLVAAVAEPLRLRAPSMPVWARRVLFAILIGVGGWMGALWWIGAANGWHSLGWRLPGHASGVSICFAAGCYADFEAEPAVPTPVSGAADAGPSDAGDAPRPTQADAAVDAAFDAPVFAGCLGWTTALHKRIDAVTSSAIASRHEDDELGPEAGAAFVAAYVPQGLFICLPTGPGAWVYAVADAKMDRSGVSYSLEIDYRAAFLTKDGTILPSALDGAPDPTVRIYQGAVVPPPSGIPEGALLPDLNDDGVAELAEKQRSERWEGIEGGGTSVWTYHSGRVEPFQITIVTAHGSRREPLTESWDEGGGGPAFLVDIDGDGRADLRRRFYVHDRVVGAGAVEDRTIGPQLLARGRPGSVFDMTDPVALADARRQCPEPPKSLIAATDAGVEREESARRIACARLWNVPAADVLKTLAHACKGFYDDDDAYISEPHGLGACPTWFRAWAELEPPIVLR
jgi:hypothetical protein